MGSDNLLDDYDLGDMTDEEDEELDYTGNDEEGEDQEFTLDLVDFQGKYLDSLCDIINKCKSMLSLDDTYIRLELIETNLKERLKSRGIKLDTVLFSCKESDSKYKTFICNLYPSLASNFDKVSSTCGEDNYDTLVKELAVVCNDFICTLLNKVRKSRGKDVNSIIELATDLIGIKAPYFGNSSIKKDSDIASFVEVIDSCITGENSMCNVPSLNYMLLEKVSEGYKPTNTSSSKGETEIEEDIDEETKEIARIITTDILRVYDTLYSPCFTNKPQGVLTSAGILTVTKDNNIQLIGATKLYSSKLYEFIQKKSSGKLTLDANKKMIDISFFNKNGTLKDYYSPMYHIRNIYGIKADGTRVDTWGEFRTYLRTDLWKKIIALLKELEGYKCDKLIAQNSITDLFTTCIIVDSFDRTKSLSMRLKANCLSSDYVSDIVNNAKAIFSIDKLKLMNDSTEASGVRNLLMIFDEKAYNNEILFAYKAYEKLIKSGVQPSSKRVVIGRGLSGKDIVKNFGDTSAIVTGIFAGSGSGKGVLTLNILASLIADGCPTCYLDYKPDMASTLWDLEKELNDKGHNCRIYSIDANVGKKAMPTGLSTPPRAFRYGLNAPDGLDLDLDNYKLLPYLKSLQLLCILAGRRSAGSLSRGKKLFFILDEAQACNKDYGLLITKLNAIIKSEKPKGGNEPSEAYIYANKLKDIFGTRLANELGKVMNTTGRQGNVGLILLGQKVDPDQWVSGAGEGGWKSSPFGALVGNVTHKYIGANYGNSDAYGLDSRKPMKGSELLKERGYFATYVGTKPPAPEGIQIMKTYMVLNKNDFDSSKYYNGELDNSYFTGGLLNNIADSTTKQVVVDSELQTEDGQVRESVGFSGLMKLIMGDGGDGELAKNLSKGYEAVEELFKLTGLASKYSCIEEYLHDCSIDSIYSFNDLLQDNIVEEDDSDTGFMDADIVTEPNGATVSDFNSPIDSDKSQNQSEESIAEEDDDFMPDTPKDNEFTQQSEPEVPPLKRDNYKSPSKNLNYANVYSEEINISDNPFEDYGNSTSPVSCLNSIRHMSKIIMEEILKVVGDYGRVEKLELTHTGLVINGVAFRPRFSSEFIASLPYDIKLQVERGNIIELFYLSDIYKFKNLSVLEVDSVDIAEGRMRREMGISPNRSWTLLFRKFRYLRDLIIAGEHITDEVSEEGYKSRGKADYDLTEKLKNACGLSHKFVSSRMGGFWKTKPVKIATSALGATLGVKGLLLATSVFGAWGLLFSAFTGYGAYRSMKNKS